MTDDLTSYMSVIDTAENILIGYGMGWGTDGAVEAFEGAISAFQATSMYGPRSAEVQMCEKAILSATGMHMCLKLGFGRDQLDEWANKFALDLNNIEPLRTITVSPGI